MANPPPAPAQKKSGLGCWAAAASFFFLALLALGLIGGSTYLAYRGFYSITSPVAANIPSFDGGDNVDSGAEQKLTTFNQALQQNQPASLDLSADEMNTLIARDPTIAQYKIRLFIATTDDQAHAQASLPLDFVPFGLFTGRFVNIDATLSLKFDTDSHTVHLTIHHLKVGDQTLPDDKLPLVQQEIETTLNLEAQKYPYLTTLFSHAKTIEVKNGDFVIETE